MAKTGGEASRIGTPLHLVLESLTLCPVAGNGVFVCHVVVAKQLFHVWLLRWRLLCLPYVMNHEVVARRTAEIVYS
jgi:hypothetical protein